MSMRQQPQNLSVFIREKVLKLTGQALNTISIHSIARHSLNNLRKSNVSQNFYFSLAIQTTTQAQTKWRTRAHVYAILIERFAYQNALENSRSRNVIKT